MAIFGWRMGEGSKAVLRRRPRATKRRKRGHVSITQLGTNWEPRKEPKKGWLLSVRLARPLNLHDDRNVIERDVFSQLWTNESGISHPHSALRPLSIFLFRSSHRFSGLHRPGHIQTTFLPPPPYIFFFPHSSIINQNMCVWILFIIPSLNRPKVFFSPFWKESLERSKSVIKLETTFWYFLLPTGWTTTVKGLCV